MVLSSTLYPGVALWEAEWRWLPSLPGVDVLSLPLDLWPCPPPPSWVSTSDVLPEELSCRGGNTSGGRKREAQECISMSESSLAEVNDLIWDLESIMQLLASLMSYG